MKYRAAIPPLVAERIRHLPPDVKRYIREALREICSDPRCGVPLKRELQGYFKYAMRRYRIVFRVDRAAGTVYVLAAGHRRSIYEDVAEVIRGRKARGG